jgi:hypothetical protein
LSRRNRVQEYRHDEGQFYPPTQARQAIEAPQRLSLTDNGEMVVLPVSSRLNKVGDNDADLIEGSSVKPEA